MLEISVLFLLCVREHCLSEQCFGEWCIREQCFCEWGFREQCFIEHCESIGEEGLSGTGRSLPQPQTRMAAHRVCSCQKPTTFTKNTFASIKLLKAVFKIAVFKIAVL